MFGVVCCVVFVWFRVGLGVLLMLLGCFDVEYGCYELELDYDGWVG